ncbi:MAG: ATP-binding protein [Chloroflexota bacterium]
MDERKLPSLWGYVLGIWLVIVLTISNYVLQTLFPTTGIVMLYLLGVVIAAVFWGLGPSILVCILSVIVHDFLFVKPSLRFGPIDVQDIPTLVAFITVGMTISYLASRVRRQTAEAGAREREAHSLYALSRSLASTDDLEATARLIVTSARETLGCNAQLYMPDPRQRGALRAYGDGEHRSTGDEVAAWSFQHQLRAGAGTRTFPDASAKYLPLLTSKGAVGVLAVEEIQPSGEFTAGKERLLGAFTNLVAVALERIVVAHEAREMEAFQAATEKLQTALLDSISHDLRTPLSSVIGVLSSLKDGLVLDDAARNNLVRDAYKEAERLDDFITNLLDISRIEAGAMSVDRQPCDVRDLISVALDQMGERVSGRRITVDVGAELPAVAADFSLMVKVLLNLLDNAVKYSPPGSPLSIIARLVERQIEVEVSDRGVGIPPEELPYLFQRFHRVPDTRVPGTGLGLSICKGIVEAHGGRITAENRHGGGTIIKFTVPISSERARGQTE